MLVQETIWLGDTPVATIRPKTGGVDISYVHTDQLTMPEHRHPPKRQLLGLHRLR